MTNKSPVSIIGCGYIGKRLARQLQQQEITVQAYVSSEASLAECNQQNIPCEQIDLDKALASMDVAGRRVIYLAPPPRSGQSDTRMTNFLLAIENHVP